MTFIQEPTGYEKTILSDLQGAWGIARDLIVKHAGFEGWDRAIFHIDEAMSWEIVRNLRQMPSLLIIIRNICIQGKASNDVIEALNEVHDTLTETLKTYSN